MLGQQEVEQLIAEHKEAPHTRLLQKTLAKEITIRVHSEADYESAVKASDVLFGQSSLEILKELDEETANSLSIQTAYGASLMANKTGKDSRTLRTEVTSPNGTTQSAIESFQDQNFEGIVANATRAAYDRARELSNELGDAE